MPIADIRPRAKVLWTAAISAPSSDMTFNGAVSYRLASSSPGKYSGQDNGWVLSLIYPPLIEFDKSIIKYPNIRRFPGGASTDLWPNLQDRRIRYRLWIRTSRHASAARAASRISFRNIKRAAPKGLPAKPALSPESDP